MRKIMLLSIVALLVLTLLPTSVSGQRQNEEPKPGWDVWVLLDTIELLELDTEERRAEPKTDENPEGKEGDEGELYLEIRGDKDGVIRERIPFAGHHTLFAPEEGVIDVWWVNEPIYHKFFPLAGIKPDCRIKLRIRAFESDLPFEDRRKDDRSKWEQIGGKFAWGNQEVPGEVELDLKGMGIGRIRAKVRIKYTITIMYSVIY